MSRAARQWAAMAAALLLIAPASAAPGAGGANAERGHLLYENHCTACHTSVAHVRAQRKAQSVNDIRKQVLRWSGHLDLQWRADEVADVVDYLNSTYYHFDAQ